MRTRSRRKQEHMNQQSTQLTRRDVPCCGNMAVAQNNVLISRRNLPGTAVEGPLRACAHCCPESGACAYYVERPHGRQGSQQVEVNCAQLGAVDCVYRIPCRARALGQ
eukprot:scaffold21748_cov129-Isochrysis_galbana.AAC.8